MANHPRFLLAALGIFLFSPSAFSAVLSGGMGKLEVERVVSTIGQASVTKILQTAENNPKLFPGIQIGFEVNVMFGEDLEGFGTGNGSVPGIIPMPRIYLMKTLPLNTEFIFSFFPGNVMNTVSGLGGILKWNFQEESRQSFAASAFLGHTVVSGFDSTYSGHSWEAGALISKDFVRFKPYVGAGLLLAAGSVAQRLVTDINATSQLTLHSFIGVEYQTDLLLTGQLDFMNVSPRISLMVSKRF